MARRGQAVVETALVLPGILLVIIGLFQMVLLARTALRLGQSASELSYRCSVHALPAGGLTAEMLRTFGPDSAWGVPDPIASSIQKETLPRWRAYPGVATLNVPGQQVTVRLSYRFYPRFLFRSFQTLHSVTGLVFQPPIPGDPS